MTTSPTTETTPPPPRPVQGRVPVVFAVLGAVALVLILGPVLALGIRVPWERFPTVLAEPDTVELLRVTLAAAIWATVVTTALGVPLAVWIQHLRRGGRLVRLLVLLPLAMPPVVGGLALTAAVGRRGLTAPLLDALGWQFAFAFPGVVLAHVFIALPFVVVSVDSALRQIDREILASAAGVGMRPWAVLWRVTLPAAAPAILTGAGLAFARSLGEFGTTLTFAGSMPGVTRTMPLGIYLEREINQDRAYVLAAILILLAVLILGLAALPAALRREPTPAPRAIGDLDAARLRELTAPREGGVPVTVTTAGVTTRFPADRITAVVGPNGSGKTTLMGMIAGRLRGAAVAVGGRVVDGGRFTAPEDRGVVLLTQRPGLPHTATVAQAVTMATRDRRLTGELLDAAGLADLAGVKIPSLSGGQAAQVALVRALGARPSVLILDEPLAAIDVASATRWRRLLRATAPDRTTLLVTHDALDVAGLSDHLVVLEGGRVVADGPTRDLLEVPPNDFVAQLVGLNRLEGTVSDVDIGMITVHSEEVTVTGTAADGEQFHVGDEAVATLPPESITLRLPGAAPSPRESARNVWRGVIGSVDSSASRSGTVVTVSVGSTRLTVPVTRRSAIALGLEPGMAVECVTKAHGITVHPHLRRKEWKP
ncbi:ATP-binding cassette domain-containing protein [Corynebacterium halotolerans]|uniref:Molybdate transport system permease n=1 Tax=Corynebacterium halotolerans YIM 70093 = DSM 44683 TaxID=1121362 RepID=M1NRT1_9CORY|nr:ATP-binding cassette domain-containing protein [Corynebacterium halotolerans]AGF72212.1 molybdate transport system permease [Corynebacterium halotolerans YIM 70093 = DSM 44683]